MDIDYDIIIKYLEKKNIKYDFEIKKHIIKYSNLFPEKFNELLQNKFYYYGVIQNINKKKVGFFMSLFILLNKDFITFTENEELDYLNKFKLDINLKITNNFIFSDEVENYISKNKINKKEIINTIDILLFQCISEILDCNFIIFNFKDENIYSIYPNNILNPWKPTFLLANYDDLWYPLLYDINSKRIFSYNDIYIKKIYSNLIEYYDKDTINKFFEMSDNLKELVNSFDEPIEDDESYNISSELDDNSTFIKESNTLYNKTTLSKLTKKELLDILKEKNIKNVNIKTLKNNLIELILQN
jgi:hypothetical protein